jgi:acyl-CoA synthetase (AMP-forming)/AMP-acid ligase II
VTLIELLTLRAEADPQGRGFRFLHETSGYGEANLTYLELRTRARAIAMALRSAGVGEGDRVLLLYLPGLDFVAAFFGALCAGAVAIPAHPPHLARLRSTLPRLDAVVADARPAVVLSTVAIKTVAVAARLLSGARWLVTDELDVGQAAEWREPQINRDALALIQYTSGSTASPKGVLVTHHNLLRNSAVVHRAFGHSPKSVGVIWLPPYHDMGLIGGVVQPLFGGFPVTLMSPASFLMRPLSWLQAIARERATTSGGPNFAFDLCVRKTTPEQRAELDLSSWEVAFVGAEPVRQETLERFAEAFSPSGFRPEAFHPCYGLAESTLFVTGGVKGARPIVCSVTAAARGGRRVAPVESGGDRKLVSCGRPPPGAKVLIADPERCTQLGPEEVGEVWVASESVARGYYDRPEESERVFGARLSDTGEGPFLRTGDLGFLREGELFLTGRLKNIIIVGGRNHCAEDIERTVENCHPDLRPGCCAAFSVDLEGEERLVIAAELERRPALGQQHSPTGIQKLVDTIRGAVAELHDVRAHAVLMLRPATFPRTSSGKAQRHLCRADFLANTLNLIEENHAV